MRIAVIGTGNIGGTLGRAFARAGHEVTFGSRHPGDVTVTDDTPATVATVSDALSSADAIVLALPAPAVASFLSEHAPALTEKLVVDATNRMGAASFNASAQISEYAPTARYARAFNTLGWENFAEPLFDGEPADLFFTAMTVDRPAVEELITAAGLRPAYLGETQHQVVDSVLPLWFTLVQNRGGNRKLAFRVVEK